MDVGKEYQFEAQTYVDEQGRLWAPFAVVYKFGGAEWSFHIMALDWEDAEARVAALAGARVAGKLVACIPGEAIGDYLAREQAKRN